jgi:hypothetical protein
LNILNKYQVVSLGSGESKDFILVVQLEGFEVDKENLL